MKRMTLRVLVLGALMALYGGTAWTANDSAGGYGEGTGGSSPLPIRTSTDGGRRGHSDSGEANEIKMRSGKVAKDGATASGATKPGNAPSKKAEPESSVGNKDSGNAKREAQIKMRGGGAYRECKPCPVGMANDCC